MNGQLVPVVATVFLCVACLGYALSRVSTVFWGRYRETFTEQARFNLSDMFMFMDPKRLFYVNAAALAIVPLLVWLTTGNLIFAARARRSPAALENVLEGGFAEAFGKAVPIIVRRAEDIAALPARNPFGAAHHPQRISVRVMREGYAPGVIEALRPYVGDEDVAIVAGDLWIGFRSPPAQSRLLAAVATRKFAAPGTFRTLAAISRIAAAAVAG